jgi:DNA (cytosine-5)-methyltransferase 1
MQAGCTGLFAIERDKFAFETLSANLLARRGRYRFQWPTWLPVQSTSISTVLSKYQKKLSALSGSVDILVGGPPCQGFSSAGRREHDDPRNKLFKSYLSLVELIQPKIVLIENVRGFTVDFARSKKNYASKLRDALAEKYVVHEELLDLSCFGVPQSRTRYLLIGSERGLFRDNPFDELKGRVPAFLRSVGLSAPVSSWSAISDLEVTRNGRRPSVETPGFDEIAYSKPLTRYQRAMHDGASSLTDLRLARHSPDIANRFAQIIELSHAEGRLNTKMSSDLRLRFGLQKHSLRVLDPDRPAPTITSMPDDLLHYIEPRALTVRENARLQSFPDWFAFKGKYTTGGELRRREVPRFTQVANAVPPLASRAIGEFLRDALVEYAKNSRKPRARSRLQRRDERSEVSAQA